MLAARFMETRGKQDACQSTFDNNQRLAAKIGAVTESIHTGHCGADKRA